MSHDGDSHVEAERFPAGRWLEHKRGGDLHLLFQEKDDISIGSLKEDDHQRNSRR